MSCHHRTHRASLAVDPLPDDLRRRPDVRASDAERETVVTRLREHAAAGRLEVDELETRVGDAYAARTRGDLAGLLADLPSGGRAAAPAARAAARGRHARDDVAHHLRAYVLVNLLLLVIWAATGAGAFWPGWVLLWWGLALAVKLPLRARGRAGLGTGIG
jgi:hypothetical protein